ncbi:MAG: undecaprenyl-diphosphate phosphatase [Desulfovermiculus sp.]
MHDIFIAAIMGVVEGVTEFLPISSTGHLIFAGEILGFTGPATGMFEVVIQLGAILAVIVLYWPRFAGLLKSDPEQPFSGLRGLYLLFLTTLPASLLGLAAADLIMGHLFTPATVALALGVGALGILIAETRRRSNTVFSLDQLTPGIALGIGLFQCLALWPGFSRAAATIIGGMLLGAQRRVAAEYSFLAAVPIMFAASGYELYTNYELLDFADWKILCVGFSISFLTAWAAVKTFLHFLTRFTLLPFAWYRLAIAPVILFW